MVDREARMACEQDKIERELHLLGATAVEDKLQVGRLRSACVPGAVCVRMACAHTSPVK